MPLDIGVLAPLTKTPREEIRKVAEFGLRSCQVCTWNPSLYTDPIGQELTSAAKELGVEVTTLWAGYPGKLVWDFYQGPLTIGLVPPEQRAQRVAALQQGVRFAARWGLASISTHVGFIPEDPNDPLFDGTVEALRQVATTCRELGLGFWYETGQETPVTLLQTIEAVGLPNQGINLDTANLILYGKANPVDALDVFGQHVRGVHAKDGLYPTNGRQLGKEVPLGEGKVNFPAFMPKLKALGYKGAITIEREISGEEQARDIRAAVDFLRPLC